MRKKLENFLSYFFSKLLHHVSITQYPVIQLSSRLPKVIYSTIGISVSAELGRQDYIHAIAASTTVGDFCNDTH